MADERFQPSSLLLDEYFASGDDAFLKHLRGMTDPRRLAGFVERWKADARPWARQKMFDYLQEPMTTPGHNVVVKRLFKHAEKQRDSELMGAFLHAFDTLVRRQRRVRRTWDYAARQVVEEEELCTPKDNLGPPKSYTVRKPATGEMITVPGRAARSGKLFSYRTRYYLRRRAWRYFRWLGYRAPGEYAAAVAGALARYTDGDLAKGEHILDSWCLLSICYRKHPALTFTPAHVRLNEGASLNQLTPAPKLAKLWAEPAAAEVLWSLLTSAQSRLVRLWSLQLLQQHHQGFLGRLDPAKLQPLFDAMDSDLQQFAAEILEKVPGLGSLPIATWLGLLQTRDPSALAAICSLMVRHVSAERLDLRQTIDLATAAPAPVANLGLLFLRSRTLTAADRGAVSELAHARSEAAAPAITAFALSFLGAKGHYDVALVSRFFDALLPATRQAAWAWLTPESAGYNDPALWARLLETPYEESRLALVKGLEARAKLPGASPDQLSPVWTAVLLGVHRGGRHKIIALHQVSRAMAEHPEHAEKLLPIMAVAIRSVRPAEARVGLAAVVGAMERNPALAPAAAKAIPELRLVSQGATA